MLKYLIPLPIVLLLGVLWLASVTPNIAQSTPQPTLMPRILPLPEKEFETSPWVIEEETCAGFSLFLSLPPKCFNAEGDLVPAWTERSIIGITR